MNKAIWAKDLKPNQEVSAPFLILEKKNGTTKKGDPFIALLLGDKTGHLETKVWANNLAKISGVEEWAVGDVRPFLLTTEEYNGKLQGNVREVGGALSGHNGADFERRSEYDPEVMWSEFSRYLGGFESHYIRAVACALFSDAGEVARFIDSAAAENMHHAFKHGLLEHTLQMLQIGEQLLSMPIWKNQLNKDLCMFGLMFHDFGKIYEYGPAPGFKKTAQGMLVPHIPMVAAKIYEAANNWAVPEEIRDHMMHVVLTHHRFLEWGSPVVFACPEAAFIHHVDNLHGDVFGMLQKRDAGTSEIIKHGYGDGAYKILKKPFNSFLEDCYNKDTAMYEVNGGF